MASIATVTVEMSPRVQEFAEAAADTANALTELLDMIPEWQAYEQEQIVEKCEESLQRMIDAVGMHTRS